MGGVLRKTAGKSLRFVQSRGAYRAAGRRITGKTNISVASPSDLEYVQARLNPGARFEPSPPDPLVTRFAAARHGRVVGFVELVRHPPEHAPYVGCWLFSLTVLDPVYRGLGIGEALALRVIDTARCEGAKELWLVVGEGNLPAIRLYQKLGFERAVVEDLEEQLENEALNTGRRRITMAKQLVE